ncbi:MAG: DNA recombination protein RmuC [Alphaproteobacteria bacterium]|nr:DNA recombination protein RmuC [Alphaproteobacteria bacterium]
MEAIILVIAGRPFSLLELLLAGAGLALCLLAMIAIAIWRSARASRAEAAAAAERQRELDDKMAGINAASAELTGRLRQLGDMVATRQSDLARLMAERLDAVGQCVGRELENTGRTTADHLSKLGERLAVIDAAQARLTGLTEQVVSLKDILANKQARGAFGQGRMEAIVRDGLPASLYDFQFTLPNNSRPDCVIRIPGDERLLAVDAKFPLEGFAALREAASAEERRIAQQRVRADTLKHIRDISEKYICGGVTQDIAMMFVPSEALYADLNEFFEDMVQKAHRAQVMIVSPSLLMMAIQLLQTLARDQQMQAQAHLIQREVRSLLDDVRRLGERAAKLDAHFRQAQDDVTQMMTSVDKISRRGAKIDQLEFSETSTQNAAPKIAAPRGLPDAAE